VYYLKAELSSLENDILDITSSCNTTESNEEKKLEMKQLLDGVTKNISRIHKILDDPGYEEKFDLDKILFSTAVQLLHRYPNVLYGDFIGHKGEKIGDKIHLEVILPEEERHVQCCGYDMQLLFYNLISNAIDAIKDKGTIWIEVHNKDQKLAISVTDDGKLLTDNQIKNIRMHKKFSSKGRKHGNGLQIVYDVLEKNDATLEAKNNPDKKGATFFATFPSKQ